MIQIPITRHNDRNFCTRNIGSIGKYDIPVYTSRAIEYNYYTTIKKEMRISEVYLEIAALRCP